MPSLISGLRGSRTVTTGELQGRAGLMAPGEMADEEVLRQELLARLSSSRVLDSVKVRKNR